MKQTVTALIQARMNSTRLPGKAMMDLAGKPLIRHVFERVQSIPRIDRVVLATCDGDDNIDIIRLAESMDIGVFVGSEDNVLERFYRASERFGGDYFMRVTGDNPFTDPFYADRAIGAALASEADICYLSNLPLGTGVGMIKKTALDIAYRHSDRPYQFEHVTPYIKEHPERFRIDICPSGLPDESARYRLTVDTQEDYELARTVYGALYRGEIFPLSAVIGFLNEHPALAAMNSGIEQRPMTHASVK